MQPDTQHCYSVKVLQRSCTALLYETLLQCSKLIRYSTTSEYIAITTIPHSVTLHNLTSIIYSLDCSLLVCFVETISSCTVGSYIQYKHPI